MAEDTITNSPISPEDQAIYDQYLSSGDGEQTQAPGGVSENEQAIYDQYLAPSSDPMEKVGAIGEAASREGMKTTGFLGGAYMGFKGGALAGPWGAVGGAALGGLSGWMFGKGLADIGGYRSPEEMPQELRPYGVAGEVIGGSVPISAVPIAAARAGASLPPSMVGKWINRIIKTAGEHPGAVFSAEMGSAVTGSILAGAMEAHYPGDTGKRIGAEIVGGFFSPHKIAVSATKNATHHVMRAISLMGGAGRERQATKVLQEMMELSGEDPELLVKLLRESGIPGVQTTAAQKTGSPALIAMESKLGAESAKFGVYSKKTAEESLETLRGLSTALIRTGEPEAIKAAGEIRSLYFRTLFSTRLQLAEAEALQAASRISMDTPGARAQLSTIADDLLSQALKDSREAERGLWAEVSKDVTGRVDRIVKAYDDIKAGMIKGEEPPRLIDIFVKDAQKTGTALSGDLIRFRSRMLTHARDAALANNLDQARIYGDMAEAALDDLDIIGARMGGEYDVARQFSYELNEAFTRSFAGEAFAKTARGARRIAPELLLKRAVGTGDDAAALRLQEIREAMDFARQKGLPDADANFDIVLDAQERVLRIAADQTVDANTGRASATKLARFLKQNERILNDFPDTRAVIQEALTSERGLQNLQSLAKEAEPIIKNRAVFSKLTDYENPVDAIRVSLSGKTPIKEFRNYIRLAKRTGPEAVDGFSSSVFDYAAQQATDASGVMSFEKLHKALYLPLKPNQQPLIKIMQSEGVVSEKAVDQFAKLLSAARKVETSLKTTDELTTKIVEDVPLAIDTFLRSSGSQAAKAAGYNTLIAQSAGSRLVRRMFDKFNITPYALLEEAMKNPELAADLLEKPKTTEEAIKFIYRIHGYAIHAMGESGQMIDEAIEQQPERE